MRKSKTILYITIVMTLLFFGCAKKESPEEYAIKLAVTKYNNAIIELYRTVSPEKLNEIALEEESKKVQSYMSIFLMGDRLMDAEYQKIDFKEVTVDGDSAIAKTSEEWRFRWIHFKTGEEIEPWTDIKYNMRYELTLVDDKWMIAKAVDIDAAEEATALDEKDNSGAEVIIEETETSLESKTEDKTLPTEATTEEKS